MKGVLFVPYTENSELAKRIRLKLKQLEDLSSLRVRVVERTGEKLVDTIHKSNPWKASDCKREECKFCKDEKLIGKCKEIGIVYEIECMTCRKKNEKENRELVIENPVEKEDKKEKPGEERKWSRDTSTAIDVDEKLIAVKYIGETSRSAFERYREHMNDYKDIKAGSHILKHYLESHRDIKMEELETKMRIIKKYKNSFERQIGESIWINYNMKEGTQLLNSKNEYNRC